MTDEPPKEDPGRPVPDHGSGPSEFPKPPLWMSRKLAALETLLEGDPPGAEGTLLRSLQDERDGLRAALNAAQADRSPEGEKPQALNAKHESAVVASGDDAPNEHGLKPGSPDEG